MLIFNLSRERFFEIVTHLPFLRGRLIHAGEIFIQARISQIEAEKINAAFPGAAWQ